MANARKNAIESVASRNQKSNVALATTFTQHGVQYYNNLPGEWSFINNNHFGK